MTRFLVLLATAAEIACSSQTETNGGARVELLQPLRVVAVVGATSCAKPWVVEELLVATSVCPTGDEIIFENEDIAQINVIRQELREADSYAVEVWLAPESRRAARMFQRRMKEKGISQFAILVGDHVVDVVPPPLVGSAIGLGAYRNLSAYDGLLRPEARDLPLLERVVTSSRD